VNEGVLHGNVEDVTSKGKFNLAHLGEERFEHAEPMRSLRYEAEENGKDPKYKIAPTSGYARDIQRGGQRKRIVEDEGFTGGAQVVME